MKINKLKFLLEYPKFRLELNKLNDIIFFFPFYQFGGAERVHINILEVSKDLGTSCFITENSANEFFRKEFEKNTHLIPYFKLKTKKYKIYTRQIAMAINKKKSPVVFGCNNTLFYDILPLLKSHVQIIDLIHAFSYEEPFSSEKVSLPMAEKIDVRVVLGEKTKNDFRNLYLSNNISEHLTERIKIIKNKVDIPERLSAKFYTKTLKVLFVARNSFEKRPHYIIEIAKRCIEKKIDVEFNVVGDFETTFSDLKNIKIIGPIDSKQKMQEIYQAHDILLITSFREGFPMVISEGMAYGVIPVSTDVGEISEIVNSRNNNGIIISDFNLPLYSLSKERISGKFLNYENESLVINDFVNALKTLYENPKLRKEYSNNAYETAKIFFSKEKFYNSYKNILVNKKSST
ncbi:glycosyltransferase family 4 protein [Chryseobacterium endophyticum]|uniref:Glycosyltransferase family 4 protein n=1 Tax=Chryseobacterium endophyticum TaxID=1854762 RepID=A0AAU6WPH3_9FLAO|nr:glycosyltransferase family 4 protein [uncultured Chryseobacterium sp.]